MRANRFGDRPALSAPPPPIEVVARHRQQAELPHDKPKQTKARVAQDLDPATRLHQLQRPRPIAIRQSASTISKTFASGT